MGNVYRVRDRELEEVVALKMLRRELVGDPDSLARFRQEVKLARRVTHKNVARTFDIGEHAGEKFLTMELVEGEPLSRAIARAPLDIGKALEIGVAVCAGLSAAHAAGVVHRDLKPDNVLLGADGRVAITDFGIARVHIEGEQNQTGSFVGTPAYMAPEQVEGKTAIDGRADLYALGAMLFEMVTGRMAWPGSSPFLVAAARLSQSPADPRSLRPDLPDALAAAILRCMARAPADRFARASDVEAELQKIDARPMREARRPLPEVPRNEPAVAVLPLRNAGSALDDYVVDGLTDDLIDTLSTTSGLRVRPRGMVARYQGERGDPRVIGTELGVQVVVDGSVRRLAESVRLSIRVISVTEGFQLWAGRFDATAAELLVVIDDAARSIAKALTVKIEAPLREAPTDALAIDLYLRAKQEFRKSWHSSPKLAVDLFEQALARAPTNPEILTGAALARARMAFFGDAAPGAAERARELAERAVVLAPHHGDSWSALYSAHMNASDPLGAVRVLRTGVTTTPKSALLQEMLGRIMLEVVDPQKAIERLEAALALDPSSVAPEFELVRAHALLGDWKKCDEILARPMLDPATLAIQRARLALWRRAPAPVATDTTPPDSYQRLWCGVLTTPKLDDAQRAFMENRTSTTNGRLRTLFWQRNAEVFAFVGEIDHALDATEGAYDSGLFDVLWADRCPILEPLRANARWPALRSKIADRAAPIAAVLGL
jgi:serine/threonine-protein kinase